MIQHSTSPLRFFCLVCLGDNPMPPRRIVPNGIPNAYIQPEPAPGHIKPLDTLIVVTVSIAVPPGFTDPGESEQLIPADVGAEQVRFTLPLKPFCWLTLTV